MVELQLGGSRQVTSHQAHFATATVLGLTTAPPTKEHHDRAVPTEIGISLPLHYSQVLFTLSTLCSPSVFHV